MKNRDLLDFAIYNIRVTYNIARKAMGSVERLLDLNGMTARDYRTTERRLERRTRIVTVDYDCCINSCYCFPKLSGLDKCPTCKEPRWIDNSHSNSDSKIPYARYQYIPVLPRIKLQMAHRRRAVFMTKYRKSIGENGYAIANLTENVRDW